jgi:O-antigen/teichoic acid export membrane protein
VLEASSYALFVLFGFQLYFAIFRWYWDKEYKEKQKTMFFTIMIFLTLVSISLCLLLFPISGNISKLFFQSEKYTYLIKLMILSSSMQIITHNPGILMRLQEKALIYMSTSTTRLIINLVFTIILIVFFHRSIEGIFEAQVLGSLVYILMIIPFLIKNMRFSFDRKLLVAMLIFSSPAILSGISTVIISITDRYFLNFSSGLDNAGLYSFGFKLANTVNMLIAASISMAITPIVFKLIDDKNNKRFYSKVMTYMVFVLTFLSLFFAAFGKEMVKVLSHNPAYWMSFQVIPILCFGIIFSNMRDSLMNGLNIVKRTKTIAFVLIISSLSNILLNAFLIPHFDYIGAAFASLLTQVITFSLMYYFAQKYYPIPFETQKLFYMLLLYCVISLGTFMINDASLAFRLSVKSLLILSFPFILYFLGFYEPIEIDRLKGFWDKWKNPANWFNNIKAIR